LPSLLYWVGAIVPVGQRYYLLVGAIGQRYYYCWFGAAVGQRYYYCWFGAAVGQRYYYCGVLDWCGVMF